MRFGKRLDLLFSLVGLNLSCRPATLELARKNEAEFAFFQTFFNVFSEDFQRSL